MTTILQLEKNELHDVIMNCVKEAISEIQTSVPPPSDRIGLKEAMDITGYLKSSIYKRSMTGAIPCQKFGKRLVFSRKELTAWMESQTISAIPAGDIISARLAKEARKKLR